MSPSISVFEQARQLAETAAAIRQQWPVRPRAGIVLGSGFGTVSDAVQVAAEFLPNSLPHYPVSTAIGHRGRLLCGDFAGQPVVVVDGRVHGYEGHSALDVVFPVRLLMQLGIECLCLTNASGGINPAYQPGDLVVLEDHINLQWQNPLRGPNLEEVGPRFPDMSSPWDPALSATAFNAALALGLRVHRGVYLAMSGPCYETAAEYRMARGMGADLVGMSTVPEVLAARHGGVRVVGLSIVSNVFRPESGSPTEAEDVVQTVHQSAGPVKDVLAAVLRSIAP
jgi:purine-nucleoside phosphorylase